jgi:hypothetical protein
MHGGLFGAGTDEAAIFKALEGRTPEEVKQLRQNYKDHYGRDLDRDLKGEMSGKDLSRAQALMKGDSAGATATALRQAMGGLGTDEKAVFSALEGKSAKEREQISAAYKKQTGRDLQSALKSELSGAELDRANATLKGDNAKADAAKLRDAMAGMGTDEAAIMRTLEGKNAKERQAIAENYKKMYGTDLSKALKSELSGSELTEAKAHLDGDTAKASAAKLRTAMAGLGTDEKAIHDLLDGKSAKEREEIKQAYRQTYGADLGKALAKEMSGNDLAKAKILMEKGKLSEAQQLKFAMEGAGTDEDAVRNALQGKTREEIAKIRTDYRKETGRELTADLASELTGRERFDASQALKGKPTTAQEAVQRLNEAHQFERGGEGNSFGRSVVDLFSDHGQRLDHNVNRANHSLERYEQLRAEGRTEEAAAEKARLDQLVGYSQSDVESVREAKDSAGDVAGTVAATAAGVAVIAVTAGTATPLVAAGLAAAAGGTSRVLVAGAIQGDGYGLEQGVSDFGRGAIDGGTAIIGAGTGKVATRAVSEAAEGVARNRILTTGVRQGIRDGLVEGAIGGGAQSLIDEKTWEGGVVHGLTNVVTATTIGTVTGAVTGGAVQSSLERGGATLRSLRDALPSNAGSDAVPIPPRVVGGGEITPPPIPPRVVDGGEITPPPVPPRVVDGGEITPPPVPPRVVDGGEINPPPLPPRVDVDDLKPRPTRVDDVADGTTGKVDGPEGGTGKTDGPDGAGKIDKPEVPARKLNDGPTDAELRQRLEAFPDPVLLQRFKDQSNFSSLKPADQLEILQMAQRNKPKPGFFDQLIGRRKQNTVEENLQRLVRDGKMGKVGKDGDTLLKNLRDLETQRMHPSFDRGEVFREVLDTVSNPGRIHQGTRGTCSATSVQYIHARTDPSDYVRVMGELTGESGQATLRSGKIMTLNRTAIAPDDSTRRMSDRVYQDSAMNHASDDALVYSNTVKNKDGYTGGHVDAQGKVVYNGLYDDDARKLLQDTLGNDYKTHSYRGDLGRDSVRGRQEFQERLAAQISTGEDLHIAMRWSEGKGGQHGYHALVAEGMDDKFVYIRNPWGKGETASNNAISRQLVDKEGRIKIDHDTFFNNLTAYNYTPVTDADKIASRLQNFTRDADVGGGRMWRELDFYEPKIRKTFPDLDLSRVPGEKREQFVREFLSEADYASFRGDLTDLKGVLERYGIDDYDPTRDLIAKRG